MPDFSSIDLGREDELVPWSEWFRRAATTMEEMLGQTSDSEGDKPLPDAPRWVFRVTLVDGRSFAITSVSTHISRGRCFLGENRWEVGPNKHELTESAGKVASVINAGRPICDVITGYTLLGSGEDGFPTVLNCPPSMISSVEAVMLPRRALNGENGANGESGADKREPFGFARWAAQQDKNRPDLYEIEDSDFLEGPV